MGSAASAVLHKLVSTGICIEDAGSKAMAKDCRFDGRFKCGVAVVKGPMAVLSGCTSIGALAYGLEAMGTGSKATAKGCMFERSGAQNVYVSGGATALLPEARCDVSLGESFGLFVRIGSNVIDSTLAENEDSNFAEGETSMADLSG